MADSILRLKVESQEYDNKLKRAAEGIQRYADGCKKAGGTLTQLDDGVEKFVKELGKMETVSRSAKGQVGEMTKAFTDLSLQYKRLTDEEKKSPFGRALAQSLDQLKDRINDTQKNIKSINNELQSSGRFGGFGNILDTIGHKMGVTGNLTDMLTSKTALLTGAIGASATAVAAAANAWANYNTEIAKQQQITTVTTGLQGDDADKMTAAARAMAKTYDVDFREAINAANTLMAQFGETGDESIRIISDGLQGMIAGDGPKLLSMIQQYAPAFHDAGISASQLVAVINNSEGGIFTDQNMNAIVMGIKNIRLMTNSTSEALEKLGIDGEEMTRKMNDGSLTVFDALKKVSSQLENVNSNSQTAGEVMQAVFGRQGAMAGTNLAKAIETLNTDLEITKHQTGEVGIAYNDLYNANKRLEEALHNTFGYKGWEEMAAGIKTSLLSAIASVLETVNALNKAFQNTFGTSYFKAIERAAEHTLGPLGRVLMTIRLISNNNNEGNPGEGSGVGAAILSTRRSSGFLGDDDRGNHPGLIVKKSTSTTPIGGGRSGGGRTNQQTYMEGSLSAQQALVSDLTKKWHDAAGTVKNDYLTQLVAAESLLAKMKESDALDKWAAGYNMRKGDINTDMSAVSGWANAGLDAWYKNAKDQKFEGLTKEGQKAITEQEKKYGKQQKQESNNEKDKSFVQVADQMVGGINNMVGSLEQMGIDMPEGFKSVMSGISGAIGVLQSIMMIVDAIEAMQSVGTFLGLFANGGVIHAAQGYVSGTYYSGDMVPAMLNSGELVLNRAQQGVLASALEGTGLKNMKLEAFVTGEQIRFVLNNNGRRTGRGEYVQTNRR